MIDDQVLCVCGGGGAWVYRSMCVCVHGICGSVCVCRVKTESCVAFEYVLTCRYLINLRGESTRSDAL